MNHKLCSLAVLLAAAVVGSGASAVALEKFTSSSDAAAQAELASREMSTRIDALLEAEWEAQKVEPAAPAEDVEFLRRAHLDLTGVIPRASEVREFLADERPDKREQLIDSLLGSPRYATHMATTWRNRILPTDVDPSRTRQAVALQKWLRTRFAKNLRYDNLVGGLLLTGGGDELGPALYYQAHDVAPEKIAASAAELFLGVKLQCAQCHDHPYADWSQREFWSFAAFFARTKPSDAGGMMRTAYRLIDTDEGDVKLPESEEVVPPKYPRGDAADSDSTTRRSQLVLWMTSRDNQFFARAAVNWAWSHMFGLPLVDTLDDADPSRLQLSEPPPTNVQILNELADHFVHSGHDLQQLWRTLANTRAYQLSSRHDDPDSASPRRFARMLPKPLTPEQLFDSFVLLAPSVTGAAAPTTAAINASASSLDEDPTRMEFVRRMRPPPGETTEYRAGTLQALMLMNGRATTGVTGPDQSSFLGALAAPFMNDDDRIEAMFLATLSREPDNDERAMFADALAQGKTPAEHADALSDMFWALLNSTEFAFNH
jgi:hypothetical protein